MILYYQSGPSVITWVLRSRELSVIIGWWKKGQRAVMLLALKEEERDTSQGMWVNSRSWGQPLTDRQQGNGYGLCPTSFKELNSSNIPNEDRNRSSPGTSRKEFSPTDTLILAWQDSCQTSDIQNCKITNAYCLNAKFVVLCYSNRKLIQGWREFSQHFRE